jgi:hypothetical protein
VTPTPPPTLAWHPTTDRPTAWVAPTLSAKCPKHIEFNL